MKLTDAEKLQITLDHQEVLRIIGATVCGRCGFMLTPKEMPYLEDIAYARAAHVDELIKAAERTE